MKKLVFLALVLLCALPLSAGDWNAIGSEGIVDESCQNLYEFSGARLQFRPGAVGTIVARYPIHPNNLQPNWAGRFTIGWAQDGVTVKLIQASLCIPMETVLCQFGPTTNAGEPGFGCATCEPNAILNMNFQQNAYYFEATLTRATTVPSPKLLMLSLP
ncbi:MAG TPA: hypothetical protein VJ276_22585 [Thermoanaerobaculia bacterium]|nr:hypothetical protein [Thermoanaerobaculia bacterium]